MGCEGDNKGLPIQEECTGIPTSKEIEHMMDLSNLFDGKYTREPNFVDRLDIIGKTIKENSSSILEAETT